MVAAAEASGAVNMVGFNYIRTPASQYARALVQSGALGQILYFRGEHTEDFLADPALPANWRTEGMATGTDTCGRTRHWAWDGATLVMSAEFVTCAVI